MPWPIPCAALSSWDPPVAAARRFQATSLPPGAGLADDSMRVVDDNGTPKSPQSLLHGNSAGATSAGERSWPASAAVDAIAEELKSWKCQRRRDRAWRRNRRALLAGDAAACRLQRLRRARSARRSAPVMCVKDLFGSARRPSAVDKSIDLLFRGGTCRVLSVKVTEFVTTVAPR